MQAENRLDLMGPEYAGGADILGPAGGLLGGLEHQQHIVGQALFLTETAGQFQKNCHMAVVAAGVHTALVLGMVVHLVPLLDGQGIRICPEGDGILLPKVKEGAQGTFHGGKDLAVQLFQRSTEICHGLGELPVQLGNTVQGTAVFDQLHSKRLRVVFPYYIPFPGRCQFALVLFPKKW